ITPSEGIAEDINSLSTGYHELIGKSTMSVNVMSRGLLAADDFRCCQNLLADTMKQQVSGKPLREDIL
ncbi:MAG: hypothetical protein VB857_14690, partial [Pirellulaceae bacterium]